MRTVYTFLFILFFSFTSLAIADKPLVERLVSLDASIDYDEAYNKSLEEMQELPLDQKEKLSGELGSILQNDKNVERRANSASALGDLCADVKGNVVFLSKASKDKEKVVRQAIVSALRRCAKTKEVVEIFKQMSSDSDESVKLLAKMALE